MHYVEEPYGLNQQDPATALVVRLDELSRNLSGFLSAHLFPHGGAWGCYRVDLSAASGCAGSFMKETSQSTERCRAEPL